MNRSGAGTTGLRRHSLTLALLSVPAVVVVRPASIEAWAVPSPAPAPIAAGAQAVPSHVPVPLRPSALPVPVGFGAAPVLLGNARPLSIPSLPVAAGMPARQRRALRQPAGGADLQVAFAHAPAIATARAPGATPRRAGVLVPLAPAAQTDAGPHGVQRWAASGGLSAPAFVLSRGATVPAVAQPQPPRATRAFAATPSVRPAASAAPRAQRAFPAQPARFDASERAYAVASDTWQPVAYRAPQPRQTSHAQVTRWASSQPANDSGPRLSHNTLWVDPTGLFAASQAAMLARSTAAGASAGNGIQRFHTSAAVAAAASLAADAPTGNGNPQVDSLVAPANDPDLQLRPYLYVPGQVAEQQPERPPAQQRLIELNLNGEYARLGREGLALMKKEKLDDELKFIVANGLAWSGRLHAAERIYQDLLGGDQALNARVALANIQRWQGKDYLAASMYKEVLASNPDHAEAREGLALTQDSWRPRLRVANTGTIDSYDVRTQTLSANYRWPSKGGARVTEVELAGIAQRMPGLHSGEYVVSARHQADDLPMKPIVQVALGKKLYGDVSVQPTRLPIRVHSGKVDWGVYSLNPGALKKALHARNTGISGNFNGRLGRASLRLDDYKVSDGNSVQTGMFRYNPPIRIGKHLRPVLGIENRQTKFNSPDYWSPAGGYTSGIAGIEGEWSGPRWNAAAELQKGWRIHGEAGGSWGAAVSGSYKLDDKWSVGGNAFALGSRRDGKGYRAQSVTLFVERRW